MIVRVMRVIIKIKALIQKKRMEIIKIDRKQTNLEKKIKKRKKKKYYIYKWNYVKIIH